MGLSVSPVQVLDANRFRILTLDLLHHYGDSAVETQLLKSSLPDDNNNNNNNNNITRRESGSDDAISSKDNWIPFSSNMLIKNPESMPIQFTMDPSFYDMVLKVPYSDSITFKFKLKLVQPMDNLTFVSANSVKQLDSFLNTELLHNPNLQNEDNVVLVQNSPANLSDSKGSANVIDFDWTWNRDPTSSNGLTGRKFLCFAEYSRRDHKLVKLYTFSLWIDHPPSAYHPFYRSLHASGSHTSLPLTTINSNTNTNTNTTAANSGTISSALNSNVPTILDEMMEATSLSRTESTPLPVSSNNNISYNGSIAGTGSLQVKHSTSLNSINPLISSSVSSTSTTNTLMSPISTTAATSTSNTINRVPSGTGNPASATSTIMSPSFSLDLNNIPELLEERKLQQQPSIAVPRPDSLDSEESTFYEDSPLFRATVSSMEKKNSHLKALVKRLLKRAIALNERQEALVDAQRLFYDCLLETSAEQNIPALQSLVHHYFNKSTPYSGIIDFNKSCVSNFKANVMAPLKKLYEQDIKTLELRKKEFDDESAQYYSWLSRYLSMKQEAKGKKKIESDNKYSEKRRMFELCRFDYYSFLSDMHGGRKQLDIVKHLASYADFESSRLLHTSDDMKKTVRPELDLVLTEINQASKDWSRHRTQRETTRRTLEQPGRINFQQPASPSTATIPPPSTTVPSFSMMTPGAGGSNSIALTSGLSDNSLSSEDEDSAGGNSTVGEDQSLTGITRPKLSPIVSSTTIRKSSVGPGHDQEPSVPVVSTTTTTTTSSTLGSKANNYQQSSESGHRKEGLLWAMARPGAVNDPIANLNKSAWHKYWVVLAGGKLSEYSNWKQSLDLHNEPINLRIACVREARSADRRFCFEVVTPQYTRVYQTTSDEDMKSWIKAVDNGITTCLNQGSSKSSSYSKSGNGSNSGSGDKKTNGPQQQVTSKLTNSLKSTGTNKPMIRTHKSSSSLSPSELLDIVKAHPSNKFCADCGATEKVEWVSINLLVILCIDCSGVHRSLGSHISKIRSLTLDTVSFTPELIELLRRVNNELLNNVWERRLDKKGSSINNRLSFITEKYVEKKFIQVLERPNAHLRKAVYDQDLVEILNAIANRANTNLIVTAGDTAGNSEFTVMSPPSNESAIPDVSNNSGSGSQPNIAKNGFVDDKTNMSLLIYAFKCTPPDAKLFPVVELLILNGAKVPQDSELPIAGLTDEQNEFLIHRAAVISRRLTVDTSNTSSPKSSYNTHTNMNNLPNDYNVVSPDRKVGNMGSKLQKRLSAGFTTLNTR